MPEGACLRDLLARPLGDQPDACAIRLADGSGAASFRELADNINEFAQALQAAGIAPGDLVSITLGNSVEFVVAFLAVTWIGATAAPLNPDLQESDFAFLLADQGSRVLLDLPAPGATAAARKAAASSDVAVWEVLASAVGGERAPTLSLAGNDPVGPPASVASIHADRDVALFLHTSGTTAKPKGVPLTHRNIMASVGNIIATYELGPTDRSLIVMPLFHVHGLIGALLAPLAAGASITIPVSGKFSASTFWTDMSNCAATWYTAVPTIHQVLLARAAREYPKENPPPLRFIRSCSAPLAPAVFEALEQAFHAPVLEAYAMTEAAHQVASNPLPANGPHRPGSVGPGQHVQIAILDDDLQWSPNGSTGEICVRGDNVFAGYRNDRAASDAAFVRGWFRTGDQGYLDEDGYLVITGRIKDLINRGGEKISPAKIDQVLLGNPAVAEAVTFPAPDPKYGEEVNSAVVLKPGATVTPEALDAFCREHLSAFETPKRFFITTHLPKTGTGKIQRDRVAAQLLG